ncbi:hypothetical protein ACIQ6V_14740 [Streptomyces sp. NPDC096198]
MCLDVGNTRVPGDITHIWQCYPGFGNQTFVVQRGQIRVADTL